MDIYEYFFGNIRLVDYDVPCESDRYFLKGHKRALRYVLEEELEERNDYLLDFLRIIVRNGNINIIQKMDQRILNRFSHDDILFKLIAVYELDLPNDIIIKILSYL